MQTGSLSICPQHLMIISHHSNPKIMAPFAPASAPAQPTPAPRAEPVVPKPQATPAPAAKEKLASIPFSKDDFKNDPLIQKALEMFKGQIVEVRA